ncbi:MAG: hypothetical protein KC591_14145 [Gemmatimonadetes bacterium]|nr:hypothetical protein [Gemmatimonadota bacterium]
MALELHTFKVASMIAIVADSEEAAKESANATVSSMNDALAKAIKREGTPVLAGKVELSTHTLVGEPNRKVLERVLSQQEIPGTEA